MTNKIEWHKEENFIETPLVNGKVFLGIAPMGDQFFLYLRIGQEKGLYTEKKYYLRPQFKSNYLKSQEEAIALVDPLIEAFNSHRTAINYD